jgi:hypothetical protein
LSGLVKYVLSLCIWVYLASAVLIRRNTLSSSLHFVSSVSRLRGHEYIVPKPHVIKPMLQI